MIQRAFVTEAELAEPCEAGAEGGGHEQSTRRHRGGRGHDGWVPTGTLADAAEASAAGGSVRLQHRVHAITETKIAVADNGGANARRPGGDRLPGDRGDAFGFAHRAQFGRTVASIGVAALNEYRRANVVP